MRISTKGLTIIWVGFCIAVLSLVAYGLATDCPDTAIYVSCRGK